MLLYAYKGNLIRDFNNDFIKTIIIQRRWIWVIEIILFALRRGKSLKQKDLIKLVCYYFQTDGVRTLFEIVTNSSNH